MVGIGRGVTHFRVRFFGFFFRFLFSCFFTSKVLYSFCFVLFCFV